MGPSLAYRILQGNGGSAFGPMCHMSERNTSASIAPSFVSRYCVAELVCSVVPLRRVCAAHVIVVSLSLVYQRQGWPERLRTGIYVSD